jgi:putative intracellular protease/amidase
MYKVLCFIYDDTADFEMTFTLHVLATRVEKEIVNIAYEKQPVKSICGVLYQPLFKVKEALYLDYVDGLIIPGGFNDEQRPELTQLIKQLYAEQKLLAAICRGPSFLARAGVLTENGIRRPYLNKLLKS